MKKTWFALTSTALLVTGVVAAGPALARLSESTAGTGGPSATEPGAASRPASSTAAKPRWAGTKQFLEVRSGATRNGVVTLAARPAKKVILGESFETQPIPGPYTDVTLVPNARILLLDGESGTPEAFLEDLRKRPADQRSEAFDLTFNAKGQVTQVEWLYVPKPAGKPSKPSAAKPRWAGTKQFLEVRSGATRNGVVTLAARPAKKVILGESFETQPIPGPYTDVTLVPNARILLLDGESGTPEAFLEDLRKRPADQRSEAFDLTFNAKGQVTQVEWLYVP